MIFSTVHQGRMFVIVQHPVEREFAKFHYLRRSSNNNNNMSYAEFAHSDHVVDNWMTRTLVHKGAADEILTIDDLYTAKELLRRKALIGLYSDLLGAIRHFVRYFGWHNNGATLLTCLESAVSNGKEKDILYSRSDELVKEDAQEGSDTWRTIMKKNHFDWELFVYAQQLYSYQIALS